MLARLIGSAIPAQKVALFSGLALVVTSFLSANPLSAQEPEPRLEPGIPQDCNENGVDDQLDILRGTSMDLEPDGIPDECQTDSIFAFLAALRPRTVASMIRLELDPATALRAYPWPRLVEYRVVEFRDRVVIFESSRLATPKDLFWFAYGL